ncbi:ATP-dependent DNA helicase [Candidatus Neptunochlamydia vexilliferae]|uniref:ATP-dependent DNA helicase n=1 Tax=Candidatus Neptunichlamydia vexilliferae TaxID=1651774 RepID=UPI001890D1B8|nr:AAA family ATPase [Candidatus Neptunochlamydia vexilliferae]
MEQIEIDEIIGKRIGPIGAELMAAARAGHLCICKEEVIEGCTALKGDEERFEGMVGRWDDLYYLQRNWVLEGAVVREFKRLLQGDVNPLYIEGCAGMNEKQAVAVEMGLSESVLCLTGGPGTGKTYTIAEIVKRYGKDVCVAAPTGKAVSVLREKLDVEVGTLHRLLGIRSGKDLLFGEKVLDYGMVIVDECSMIDVGMLAALLRAIKTGTRLILVGDHDQLPPVEAGTVFGELCRFMRERGQGYVHLDQCMRSDRKEILEKAEAVRKGEMIPYGKLERKISEWKKEFKKGGFRLLSCLRRGPFGVDAINELMWEKGEIPIIITRTDKRMELSNGEMGTLMKRSEGRALGKEDEALFGERRFPAVLLPEFEYAYCLSVHKSQGSEFERVVLLVPQGAEAFGREILYTGITRAKEEIEILADEGMIEACVSETSEKMSGIRRRLCAS